MKEKLIKMEVTESEAEFLYSVRIWDIEKMFDKLIDPFED